MAILRQKEKHLRKIIKKFRGSHKRNYDCLTKASQGFQEVVFKFCQRMFREENFPVTFQDTTLHMIAKPGKGCKKEIFSD